MKKFTLAIAAFAAMLLASCGGQNAQQSTDEAVEDSASAAIAFEQSQIKESIKANIDSIAAAMNGKSFNNVFDNAKNGKIVLTEEEKKVKPEYLFQPDVAKDLATYSQKYAALPVLMLDREVAKLYDIDVTEYDNAIAKLTSEINDPAFKEMTETDGNLIAKHQALYDGMDKEGRINFYWILSAAGVVENLYVMSQNVDKFLADYSDEDVENITFRLVCILDALDRLSVYDPQIPGIAESLSPLKVLNAVTVEEFKSQLATAKADIEASRNSLLK